MEKNLLGNEIWVEDFGRQLPTKDIEASHPIGIDYAGEDAKLPWRFTVKGNLWISK